MTAPDWLPVIVVVPGGVAIAIATTIGIVWHRKRQRATKPGSDSQPQ